MISSISAIILFFPPHQCAKATLLHRSLLYVSNDSFSNHLTIATYNDGVRYLSRGSIVVTTASTTAVRDGDVFSLDVRFLRRVVMPNFCFDSKSHWLIGIVVVLHAFFRCPYPGVLLERASFEVSRPALNEFWTWCGGALKCYSQSRTFLKIGGGNPDVREEVKAHANTLRSAFEEDALDYLPFERSKHDDSKLDC